MTQSSLLLSLVSPPPLTIVSDLANIDRVTEDGEMLLVGFLLDIDRVADCFNCEVLLDNDRVEAQL